MKRIALLSLVALTMTACGGGGGGSTAATAPSIDDVTEGSGTSLSISTDAATSAALAKEVLVTVDSTFSSGIFSALSGQDTTAFNTTVCDTNTGTLTLPETTEAGTSGGLVVAGNLTVVLNSSTAGSANYNVSGSFNDYTYASTAAAGDLALSGTGTYLWTQTVTAGARISCPNSGQTTVVGTDTTELQGSLSISGANGAAMTYAFTSTGPVTVTESSTVTLSGSVKIKSGGETATCTVSGTGTGFVSLSSYLTVDCS